LLLANIAHGLRGHLDRLSGHLHQYRLDFLDIGLLRLAFKKT
jgi:hypothetical protein